MGNKLLLVGSVTYAMKGKELLLKHGISATVEKTPKRAGVAGCGYGIVPEGSADRAEDILSKHGIKVIGVVDRGHRR